MLVRPLLEAIGFHLGRHLQNIGAPIDGMSEKELKSETAHISPTIFKGPSYAESDDDPIELPECVQAGVGVDYNEVIQKAVLKAVEDAKAN